MRKLATSSMACATALGAVIGVAPKANAQAEITVYVSPSGTRSASAAGDGLSAHRAVRSLAEAVRVLKTKAVGASKATLVIGPGVYADPIDLRGVPAGTRLAVACKKGAVLDGRGADGYAITVTTSSTFDGCTIKNWTAGGILARGDGARLGGIVVKNMTFSDLGTKRKQNRGRNGFAAVHLKNVKSAKVTGNRFVRLENGQRYTSGKEVVDKYGNMHGVYFSVDSSGSKNAFNIVKGNTFDTISGDPIRMSDASSYVYASGNTFKNAGYKGMVTYWYFARDPRCGKQNYAYNNTGRMSYRRPKSPSKRIPHVASESPCKGSVKDGRPR